MLHGALRGAGLLLGISLPFCALSTNTARIDFDIPQATLDVALARFAEQSRRHVFYSPALVARRRSPSLNGRMSAAQALARLLEGSHLTAVAVNTNTYVLQPATSPRSVEPERPHPASEPVPDAHKPIELQSVQVTGSLIPRTSLETTVPVSVITREQIDSSGFTTLFDLLRHQPGMVGHHAVEAAAIEPQSQSLSSIAASASAHSASLYGLGPRGTLYLVDGRRVADYVLPSSSLGGLSDLASIPLSMVERVEIQRGGASAIYGSDAAAGVVNVILKRDYLGAEAAALYGLSARGDAQILGASANGGFEVGALGHLSINVDRFSQQHLAGDTRGWHTSDLGRFGLPDHTIELGYLLPTTRIDPFPSCKTAIDPSAPACRLDRLRYRSLKPGIESRAASLHWMNALPRDAEMHADLRYTGGTTRIDTAPMFLVGDIVPPLDPYYAGASRALHAFYELGPISSRTRSTSLSASVDVNVPVRTWSFDFGIQRQVNRAKNTISGMVDSRALLPLVATSRYQIDGRPNDPGVLESLAPPLFIAGEATLLAFTARMHGQLGTIAGRPIKIAMGTEYQRDDLELAFDPYFLQAGYSYVGDPRDYSGHRHRHAAHAEFMFPAGPALTLETAWRIDGIDAHGTSSSPRAGLTWHPAERVLLRASIGRSFRMPTLLDLNVVPSDTWLGQSIWIVQDPNLPRCLRPSGQGWCNLKIHAVSNPDLRPERALFRGIGMVWAPMHGMDLAIDYFNIVRTDEIVTIPSTDLIASPARFPQTWGLDPEGGLHTLNIKQLNLARSETRGLQADATWRLSTRATDTLAFSLSASHILDARVTVDDGRVRDRAGYRAPATTALASLQWRRHAWSTSLHLRHFSSYAIHDSASPCPTANDAAGRCRNPSISTVALGVSYTSPSGWRASAFANNLTDHTPVDYDTERAGYNPSFDDAVGRNHVIRFEYQF